MLQLKRVLSIHMSYVYVYIYIQYKEMPKASVEKSMYTQARGSTETSKRLVWIMWQQPAAKAAKAANS